LALCPGANFLNAADIRQLSPVPPPVSAFYGTFTHMQALQWAQHSMTISPIRQTVAGLEHDVMAGEFAC
jgi:hypothetical protein